MPDTGGARERRTFTAPQRLLRAIALAYAAWCVFVLAMWLAAVLGAYGPQPEGDAPVVSVAILQTANAGNLALAAVLWCVSNHPRLARAFKFVAMALALANAVPLVSGIVARQFGDLVTGAYNVFVWSLISWLSVQLDHEWRSGRAPDVRELPRTVTGRAIRTERALERAIEAGTLAAPDRDGEEAES